jgi:hypothetical protein
MGKFGKLWIVVVAAVASQSVGYSQGPTDFQGTWLLLEPEMAPPPPAGLVPLAAPQGRGGRGGGRGGFAGSADVAVPGGGRDGFDAVLQITAAAGEMTVAANVDYQDPRIEGRAHAYRLDGRETTFEDPAGTIRATAALADGRITVTWHRSYASPLGDVTLTTKDVYIRSGDYLYFDRTENPPGGGVSRRVATYKRIDPKLLSSGSLALAAEVQPQPIVNTAGNAGDGTCPSNPAQFHQCAQERMKTFTPPKRADGTPNLEGYWTTSGAFANVIEEHGPGFALQGAPSIIVDPADGKIPYQKWAFDERTIRRRVENAIHDPQGRCFPAGVPHNMYVPYGAAGLQFLQTKDLFTILWEYDHYVRLVPLDGRPHISTRIELWDGDSIGRWEGNTLVVDTTNLNGKSWLDLSGDFTGKAHVVERFTLVDENTIHYQATIDNPEVFTRPWTISFPYSRVKTKGIEILEQACHEDNQDVTHIRGNRQ